MSDLKSAVGAEPYEQLRALLEHLFPSGNRIRDGVVDACVREMWANQREAYAALFGDRPLPPGLSVEARTLIADAGGDGSVEMFQASDFLGGLEPAAAQGARVLGYYEARAMHNRTRTTTPEGTGPEDATAATPPPAGQKMKARFTPTGFYCVRVRLPDVPSPGGDVIETAIGDVILTEGPEGDHICGSVERTNECFGTKAKRVELITSGRTGARFAPISIYLGYAKEGDKTPSFYALEGGTVRGEAMQVYLGGKFDGASENWGPEYCSDFNPTLLSSTMNRYSSRLRLDATGEHPKTLIIHAREPRDGDTSCPCWEDFKQAQPNPNEIKKCPPPSKMLLSHPQNPADHYISITTNFTFLGRAANGTLIVPKDGRSQSAFVMEAMARVAVLAKKMDKNVFGHGWFGSAAESLVAAFAHLEWDDKPELGT